MTPNSTVTDKVIDVATATLGITPLGVALYPLRAMHSIAKKAVASPKQDLDVSTLQKLGEKAAKEIHKLMDEAQDYKSCFSQPFNMTMLCSYDSMKQEIRNLKDFVENNREVMLGLLLVSPNAYIGLVLMSNLETWDDLSYLDFLGPLGFGVHSFIDDPSSIGRTAGTLMTGVVGTVAMSGAGKLAAKGASYLVEKGAETVVDYYLDPLSVFPF